ncbi:MAG: ATP-binding cassette domain-containing protein [Kofleriaceae bacterium]
MALVELENVRKKYYAQTVLDGVSFDIREGEVFGYIGPNGAGKTTTLKILAGLLTKYDGTIRVGGDDIKQTPAHKLIGFMPQSCGFQNWRTVDSALDSLGELSGVSDEDRRVRIPRLLERFDLLGSRFKKVKELSGGMTQKLGLIQALLHEPRLLVLDEPLEGLDPPSRNLLKEVIRERRRAGTTVLFSSHILSDVEDVADRIGILHRGKLATSGSIRELVSGFGLPTDIAVSFAKRPSSIEFLAALGTASERKPDEWRIRLADGTDPDAVVHTIIERTLAGDGRIRKVGIAEPNLDDLFAQYIERAETAARAAYQALGANVQGGAASSASATGTVSTVTASTGTASTGTASTGTGSSTNTEPLLSSTNTEPLLSSTSRTAAVGATASTTSAFDEPPAATAIDPSDAEETH